MKKRQWVAEVLKAYSARQRCGEMAGIKCMKNIHGGVSSHQTKISLKSLFLYLVISTR